MTGHVLIRSSGVLVTGMIQTLGLADEFLGPPVLHYHRPDAVSTSCTCSAMSFTLSSICTVVLVLCARIVEKVLPVVVVEYR